MPVKPILMSDLRKTAPSSPMAQHRNQIGNGAYNRFNLLAPARNRILSAGKRLLSDDDVAPASPKIPRLSSTQVFDRLASQDKLLDAAKASLKTARDALILHYRPDDGGLGTILANLGAAVENIILHSEATKSGLIDLCKAGETSFASGKLPEPRHPRANNSAPKMATAKPPPTAEENAASKVKRVLREAERRTVLFDLDMGGAPIINKESISRKVTMALHGAASSGNHDWNIKDAGEMVDDVLSCSQLEFLGNGTKKFFNNKKKDDPRNGKMCTVPVRMDFKNKETRISAEHTLRTICKVSCSTPYPKKLRALLGRAILEGKKKYPKLYIRPKVDIDNMQVSASAREGATWHDASGPFPIPLDILDPNTVIPPLEREESMEIPVVTASDSTPVS